MKLPKTVEISGKTYKVNERTVSNSSGRTYKQEVVVGIKSQSEERIFENYLHEVSELVACEQSTRFTASDDEVVFVMNHKQFGSFVNDIATAIRPMLK